MFDQIPELRTEVHGCVNLMGEPSVAASGYTLPATIVQTTVVEARVRNDRSVRVASGNVYGSMVEFGLGREGRRFDWANYVQGVTWAMQIEMKNLGIPTSQAPGLDILVNSSVPMGYGLCSSAALVVAVMRICRDAWGLSGLISDHRVAEIAQFVEREFLGKWAGAMAQTATALGRRGQAIFVDPKDNSSEAIDIDPSRFELLVLATGISRNFRGQDSSGYEQRRDDCEKVCEALGVSNMLALEDREKIETLPEPLISRARHILGENDRAKEAALCLKKGDALRLGELFDLSHASMRDNFRVLTPDVERLLAITREHPDALGVRLTGGGTGTTIVALVNPGYGEEVGKYVVKRFRDECNRRASILVPEV